MLMAAETTAGTNFGAALIPFVLVFVVFHLLVLRPQKKQMQKEQEFQKNLLIGEEVFTKSGIIGTIVSVDEKTVVLELESKNKMKLLRSEVASSTKVLFDKKD